MILVLHAAAAAVPAAASAATDGAGTLRAAVDRAARLDPLLRTLDARADEVDASRTAAAALFPGAPVLGASLRRDRPDRDLGRNEVEFEVGLLLWLPGQRALRQQLAGDEGTGRDAAVVDARLQVAGRVREALWALAFARLDETAARRRIGTVERLVADVERRVAVGVLARADLLLARAEAAAARGLLIEAGARVEQALQAWRALTGDGLLPVSWVEAEAEAGGSVRASGSAAHPSVVAALGEVDLARSRLKLASESTRDPPEIGLQHRSDREATGADHRNSIRVALRVPLATDARNRPRIAAANTERVRAESALLQVQRRIEADTARARAELDAARAQEANARERLRDAGEHLALVRRAFDLGEQSLVAMLRALALADEAQADLDRQVAARDRATARINQAAGVLP
ncbi:MAG: TolC family protein [bacterium]|jgi:outer membrane protein TolC|nr:TolC family protein [Betaproteobacteria bacterium]